MGNHAERNTFLKVYRRGNIYCLHVSDPWLQIVIDGDLLVIPNESNLQFIPFYVANKINDGGDDDDDDDDDDARSGGDDDDDDDNDDDDDDDDNGGGAVVLLVVMKIMITKTTSSYHSCRAKASTCQNMIVTSATKT